ncbi:hypothetical protein C8J57DRAFT_742541 [Mycena rebaudengoi]|nr:hypothetical protein C8J57DRAFT_742541 [Mycena rebaudengoi]
MEDADVDPLQTVETRISLFIDSLPVLSKDTGLDTDDSCPICLTSFEALLTEGVTKLRCGHIFCRKDLLEWIRSLHGNCPTCRFDFLDIRPPGSDDESDGGEYLPPNEDDEDDDDIFMDTSDGFTDADFDVEDMEIDFDDMWERSDSGDIPVEAESELSSEGDISINNTGDEVSVSITEDEDDLDDSFDELHAEEPK